MSGQSAIVLFGFENHTEFFDDKALNRQHSAVSKFCLKRKTISQRLETTSAFNRHLRLVHPAKHKEYLMQSNANQNDGQTTVDSFFELNTNYLSEPSTFLSTKKSAFNEKHPRRKAINDAIVNPALVPSQFERLLILGCLNTPILKFTSSCLSLHDVHSTFL